MSDLGTPDGREDTFGDDADLRPIVMTDQGSVVEALRAIAAGLTAEAVGPTGRLMLTTEEMEDIARDAIPLAEAMEKKNTLLTERVDRLRYMVRKKTERIEAMEKVMEAVKWVLDDAAYKAPEQFTDIDIRWLSALRSALDSLDEEAER